MDSRTRSPVAHRIIGTCRRSRPPSASSPIAPSCAADPAPGCWASIPAPRSPWTTSPRRWRRCSTSSRCPSPRRTSSRGRCAAAPRRGRPPGCSRSWWRPGPSSTPPSRSGGRRTAPRAASWSPVAVRSPWASPPGWRWPVSGPSTPPSRARCWPPTSAPAISTRTAATTGPPPRPRPSRGWCRRPAPARPPRHLVPDLVVLADASAPDPAHVAPLMAAGTAHLPVRLRDGTGVVGPLVLPGPLRLPALPGAAPERVRRGLARGGRPARRARRCRRAVLRGRDGSPRRRPGARRPRRRGG